MTHVEQGELQAYLDREVPAGSRAEIDAHVRSCTACTAELEQLRAAARLFSSAVRPADVQPPVFAAFAAVNATRGDVARRRFALSRTALSRAALFIIGLATVASAAIPGSPVREWIVDTLRIGGATEEERPAVQAPEAAQAEPVVVEDRGAAALSIQPVDSRVRVVLTNVAVDAVVRVRLINGDRAVIHATGGAESARFKTGPGRIELVGITKGEVTVEIPRSVLDARVEVDGRVVFENR